MANTFVGQAWVQINPSVTGFQDTVKSQVTQPLQKAGEDSANTFGSRFKQVFAGVLAANVVQDAASQVVNFVKGSITAYQTAEETTLKWNDALSRIPGASKNVTAALGGQATALSQVTTYSAGQTKQEQAALAQFGLTGAQLKTLTPLVQDYAARTGQDLPTAAESVGKALLGQGRALKSVGIDFKNTGTTTGNFQEIVDGLQSHVGGLAQEMGKTSSGQLQIMQNQFKALQVSVGAALMPALVSLIEALKPLVPVIQQIIGVLKPILGFVAELVGWFIKLIEPILKPLVFVLLAVVAAWVLWNVQLFITETLLSPVIAPIVAIGLAVVGLIVIIKLLIDNWSAIWNAIVGAVKAAWNWLVGFFTSTWPWILGALAGPIGLAVVAIIKYWSDIEAAFQWAYNVIIAPILGAIGAAWNAVVGFFVAIWTTVLLPAINAIEAAFLWMWNVIILPIFNAFNAAWSFLGTMVMWVWQNVILAAWTALWSTLSWIWNVIINPVFQAISGAFSAVGNGIMWVWENVIQAAFNGIKAGVGLVRDAFQAAKDAIGKIWDGLRAIVMNPVKWVIDLIINPFIDGINWIITKFGIGAITKVDTSGWKAASGGRVPEQDGFRWGGGDRVKAVLEPGEWVLTKHQAKAIGYENLSRISAGGSPPRYGATVDPWGAFEMFNPLKSAWHAVTHPISTLESVGKDIWNLGSDVVNTAAHLFRAGVADAVAAGAAPLLALLDKIPSSGPWSDDIKTGIHWITDQVIQWIRGHSETQLSGEAGAQAQLVINNARAKLGSPYVWGARGPSTFDCSGLVDWSFGTAPGAPTAGWTGPRVGPTTNEQQKLGKPISESALGLADLIFFGSPIHHVALALGGGQMIHAPHTGTVVQQSPVYHDPAGMLYKRLIEQAAGAGAVVGVENLQGLVQQAFQIQGKPAPEDWINAVLIIIKGESGGNANAINLTDSNAKAGHPSQGLMQLIPSTFAAYHVAGTSNSITDPLANIAAGIAYSFARYGNVTNVPGVRAVTSGGKYVGYAEGGRIPGWGGGDSVVAALEPGEWVLTKHQAKALGYANLAALPHFQGGGSVGPPTTTIGSPAPMLGDGWDWISRVEPSPTGPAITIDNATFSQEVDIELLLKKATWYLQTRGPL